MAGALGNFWPSVGKAKVSSRRVGAETYLFPVSPEVPSYRGLGYLGLNL